MVRSNIKATFACNVETVWDVVTSLENYQWRSDLSRIEIVSDNTFIEYTRDGYATTFTITFVKGFLKKQQEQYVSDLRNAI